MKCPLCNHAHRKFCPRFPCTSTFLFVINGLLLDNGKLWPPDAVHLLHCPKRGKPHRKHHGRLGFGFGYDEAVGDLRVEWRTKEPKSFRFTHGRGD